jgi:hypothetical protein
MLSILILSIALVSSIALRIIIGPITYDDAYITFRYADNLATGLGLIYNSGERVLGTTSPRFAIVLALLKSLLGLDVV